MYRGLPWAWLGRSKRIPPSQRASTTADASLDSRNLYPWCYSMPSSIHRGSPGKSLVVSATLHHLRAGRALTGRVVVLDSPKSVCRYTARQTAVKFFHRGLKADSPKTSTGTQVPGSSEYSTSTTLGCDRERSRVIGTLAHGGIPLASPVHSFVSTFNMSDTVFGRKQHSPETFRVRIPEGYRLVLVFSPHGVQ